MVLMKFYLKLTKNSTPLNKSSTLNLTNKKRRALQNFMLNRNSQKRLLQQQQELKDLQQLIELQTIKQFEMMTWRLLHSSNLLLTKRVIVFLFCLVQRVQVLSLKLNLKLCKKKTIR